MDFSDRLRDIETNRSAEDQVYRDLLAQRAEAGQQIERLLKETVQFLVERRVPTQDLLGMKEFAETHERKPLLRRPVTYTNYRSVAVEVGQGWDFSQGSFMGDGHHLVLTDRAELVKALTPAELTGDLRGNPFPSLAQPTRISTEPEAITVVSDSIASAAAKPGYFTAMSTEVTHIDLPQQAGFGLLRDGSIVFIEYRPDGGEWRRQNEWRSSLLEDMLATTVKLLLR